MIYSSDTVTLLISVHSLPSTDETQIVIRPQQLAQVNAGSSMTLACVAYGDPIPTISWNKGSSRLTNSSEVTIYQEVLNISGLIFAKSILEICALDEDDAGQYSCFAESSTSNDTANFELSVTNQGIYLPWYYRNLRPPHYIAIVVQACTCKRSYPITEPDCELDCWTGLMDWIAGLSSYHPISSQSEEQRGHMILLARTMAY